ncbi:homoserine dehydrogenase [Chlorella sorokiniana]|uniref:Homoserine dehydrogenase n=1 Tax=Chlorella sorokiniana TaxID=3076 RepID=A0A2P6TP88_CHLSO|nr:homoserine dehydrogenase [Chlorella sorokiniana]|eukprot:PRW51144.1 homoserine dehydrogenase [Chlorella sorokiniana]
MAGALRRAMETLPVAVGLVGPGAVGRALLEQLRVETPNLREKYGIDLQVQGILNSQQVILGKEGQPIDLETYGEQLLHSSADASLGVLTQHLRSCSVEHKVIIDCTASSYVPQFYRRWMEQGIHVVTPNKKLNSGPLAEYLAVKQLQRQGKAHYMYEGTVGAGLPVISTLKQLLDTGDEVQRIEGVFSGTLSYVFNTLEPGKPFSEVVWGARRRGYTEPDPREDLSGMDVTRKVINLARECGNKIELAAVDTESLVPEPLKNSPSPQEFMDSLHQFDGDMEARLREAEEHGEVLRYVGSYDAESGVCQAHVRRFPKSHPFAHLSGTENIIAFTTLRYSNPPLIVRGPGAGPAVTAAGVFGDLITLARYLGAPS